MVFICPYSQSREDRWDRLPGLGFDPENKAVTGMGRLRFELRTNRLKADQEITKSLEVTGVRAGYAKQNAKN